VTLLVKGGNTTNVHLPVAPAVLVGPCSNIIRDVAEVDDEADIGRGVVSRCDVVDVVVPCWSASAS
jgi:hypothetical protein